MSSFVRNPHARKTPDPSEDLLAELQALGDPRPVHRRLPGYAPTPLRRLEGPARQAGVGELWAKDESHRFGLGAFKGLGASYAIHRHLEEDPGTRVFTTASEGNHGRAVAWASRIAGCEARIFLPADTRGSRVRAIEEEGATVEMVAGDYEAAVAQARKASEREGWALIQDTAWEGYRTVPLRIMAGYTTAIREVEEELGADTPPFDLVLLQGGVGSWAASIAAHLALRWGAQAPRVVVVEPTAAACLLASARAGRSAPATGNRQTAMDGLNCGVASSLAVPILLAHADLFIAVDDEWAQEAVDTLASQHPAIPSAPAGAAGLAGLLALTRVPELNEARQAAGLGPDSRVLIFNTEGAWR
jgi:diaminopropionate ammonia-lyase